jgi:hypothetical protein
MQRNFFYQSVGVSTEARPSALLSGSWLMELLTHSLSTQKSEIAIFEDGDALLPR